jgi:hypothetical protein
VLPTYTIIEKLAHRGDECFGLLLMQIVPAAVEALEHDALDRSGERLGMGDRHDRVAISRLSEEERREEEEDEKPAASDTQAYVTYAVDVFYRLRP